MADSLPDRTRPSAAPAQLDQIFDIESKAVVVTGAASGLGRAVARGFAALGADVVGLDLDAAGLEDLEADLVHVRGSFLPCVCDASQPASVADAFQVVSQRFSHLDALLHFAGIAGPLSPTVDMSEQAWDRVIDTNLKSAFLMCKASIPLFRSGCIGKIVLTSSTWGLVGSRRVPVAAYAASKAGITGLAAQLAVELAPVINVNTIVPAGVRSAIADGFYDDPAAVQALIDDLPTCQIRDADTIVGLCLLLATSASDHMTGSVIPVDGGFLAY